MGVSSRRCGVAGFEADGELYAKRRRRVGVVGGIAEVEDEEAVIPAPDVM